MSRALGTPKFLAYIQRQIGYTVKPEMPQLTGPEVERLHKHGRRCLAVGSLDG